MSTIAIRIPSGMTTKEAKSALVAAIDEKLSPSSMMGGTESARIAVDGMLMSKLSNISKNEGKDASRQDIASRLILAYVEEREKAKETQRPSPPIGISLIDKLISSGKVTHRSTQLQASASLSSALAERGVLMMEAATGTGKTMACLASAVDTLRRYPGERIAIAVPTINLMDQVEREYAIIQSVEQDAPRIAFLIGRAQFLSVFRLESMLDDVMYAKHKDAVLQWLKDNRRDNNGSTISKLPLLAAGFAETFPDLPVPTLDSDSKKDDPGVVAYRAQFDRLSGAGIIVITHAMLALDTRLRRFSAMRAADEDGRGIAYVRELYEADKKENGETRPFGAYFAEYLSGIDTVALLPRFDRLIVDEGDALEQAFSMANTDEISIYELTRNGSLSDERRRAIVRIFRDIIAIGSRMDGDRLLLNNSIEESMTPDVKCAISLLSELAGILKSARKKDNEIKRAQKALEHMAHNLARNQFVAFIDFSPIYRYPRLRIGEKSVTSMLQFLWANVKSAAIVSATLLLPSKGEWSPKYISSILRCDPGMTRATRIQPPDWLFNPVTAFMPEQVQKGERLWLQKPSKPKKNNDKRAMERFGNDMAEWLSEQAAAIEHIADTAVGGTLILMSSYNTLDNLSKLLESSCGERLVVARRGWRIAEQRKQFETLHRQGLRPVWLSVGAAWRGLDITDLRYGSDQSFQDTMLTDLVIPHLPFGMNQTISHAWRKEYMDPWAVEINETLMFLKQGIGRLVRRDGIRKCRRLFLLDTRIYGEKNFTMMRNGLSLILSGYKKETFKK